MGWSKWAKHLGELVNRQYSFPSTVKSSEGMGISLIDLFEASSFFNSRNMNTLHFQ